MEPIRRLHYFLRYKSRCACWVSHVNVLGVKSQIDQTVDLIYSSSVMNVAKETMNLRLDLGTRRGKKKLEKLLREGWAVVVQQKRGLFQFSPRQTDLVLERELTR